MRTEALVKGSYLTNTQLLVLGQMGVGGPWLAGGAARRMHIQAFLGRADMDIWFRSNSQLVEFRMFLLDNGGECETSKKSNQTWNLNGQAVQLITGSYYDDIEGLLSSFDYCLCQWATDGEKLYYTKAAEADLRLARLSVNKITLPLHSLARVMKYESQGFTPSDTVLLELSSAAMEFLKVSGQGSYGEQESIHIVQPIATLTLEES